MASKVAEEVAAAEFDRMCDANALLRDETQFKPDEIDEWKELRDRTIEDICRGVLAINPDGMPVYTIEGKSYTFRRATGATLMALETYAKDKSISNTLCALADVTGAPKNEFGKMDAREVSSMCRLLGLFLNGRRST